MELPGDLTELLSIPSVSAQPAHATDMRACAEWLQRRFTRAGLTAEILPTGGHPLVFAQRQIDPGLPTVLIYGHYDVQPPEPLELWHTPPFEPTVREGKVYARGASDNKGQFYCHLRAVEDLGADLAVNVKFLIEGEEEIGSQNLERFIRANQELLAADLVLISDSAMVAPGIPALTYGLRGLAGLEAKITGPDHDLHSGAYGGVAPNPIDAVALLLASLKDRAGKVTVPGFYDQVVDLEPEERELFAQVPLDEPAFLRATGAPALRGEAGFTPAERAWARPALDVNGVFGGYQGAGSKTVIPAEAGFKITVRLVPNQKPEEVTRAIEAHLRSVLPEGFGLEVSFKEPGSPAVLVSRQHPAVQAAREALREVHGREPNFVREGGSIPVVGMFKEILSAPVVLIGLGLPDDRLHSPNEKLDLKNLADGIAVGRRFLELLPQYLQ